MDRLLDIEQLSTTICLAKQTIYNRLNRGEDLPPAIRLGRALRWRESDVNAWVAGKLPSQTLALPVSPPPCRRPGRPTKAEQVAHRGK